VSFAFVGGVLFLDVACVEEDDLRDFCGCLCAEYSSVVAFFYELWEQAAVVEVGVGEQYGVDAFGADGEWVPVSVLELSFLVEAAVDEDLEAVNFDKEPRAGNVAGGAEETEFDFEIGFFAEAENFYPSFRIIFICSYIVALRRGSRGGLLRRPGLPSCRRGRLCRCRHRTCRARG
jgi:hypothetical protein